MSTDPHELHRRRIDETLAAGTPMPQDSLTREHLDRCQECQEYLEESTRVIAALGSFSFEVEPSLQVKVSNALQVRARQRRAAPIKTRELVWTSAVAVLFTTIGCFLDLRFGAAAAAHLPEQGLRLREGLLTIWIVASLVPLLLFPLLPLLGSRDERFV